MDSTVPPALVSGGRERGIGLRSALCCRLGPMPLFLSSHSGPREEAPPLEFLPGSPENAAATGFGGRMN